MYLQEREVKKVRIYKQHSLKNSEGLVKYELSLRIEQADLPNEEGSDFLRF